MKLLIAAGAKADSCDEWGLHAGFRLLMVPVDVLGLAERLERAKLLAGSSVLEKPFPGVVPDSFVGVGRSEGCTPQRGETAIDMARRLGFNEIANAWEQRRD
jgi:hypothetical protein